nr:thrombospondin type 3 repeat-containing protein [Flavobacteriales bacterium]
MFRRFLHVVLPVLLLLLAYPLSAQDSDGDGAPDMFDNCPTVPNPGQLDSDTDGVGDACDNCVMVPNPGQANADMDGFGNACDNCPFIPNDQADVDSDGLGNACDGCPFDCDDGDPCTIDACVDNACVHMPYEVPPAALLQPATPPGCLVYMGRDVLIDMAIDDGLSTTEASYVPSDSAEVIVFAGTVLAGSTPCFDYAITHYFEPATVPEEYLEVPESPVNCMLYMGVIVNINGAQNDVLTTVEDDFVPSDTGAVVFHAGAIVVDFVTCFTYEVAHHFEPYTVPEDVLDEPAMLEPCMAYMGCEVLLNGFYSIALSTTDSNYVPSADHGVVLFSETIVEDFVTCIDYVVGHYFEPVVPDPELFEPPPSPDPCLVYIGRKVIEDFVYSTELSTMPFDSFPGPSGDSLLVSETLVNAPITCYDYIITFYYDLAPLPPAALVPPTLQNSCVVYVGRTVERNGLFDPNLSDLENDYAPLLGGEVHTSTGTVFNGSDPCYTYIVTFHFEPLPIPAQFMAQPPQADPCMVYKGRAVFIDDIVDDALTTTEDGYSTVVGTQLVQFEGTVEALGVPCYDWVVVHYFDPMDCDDDDPCTLDECFNGQCFNTPYAPPASYLVPAPYPCFNYLGRQVFDHGAYSTDLSTLGANYDPPFNAESEDETYALEVEGGLVVCYNYLVRFWWQPVFCDDGDPCTIDTCDPMTGLCVYTPMNCDDGDPCTIDICLNGTCFNLIQNCDDGNPCTVDFCDAMGVCQHVGGAPDLSLELQTDDAAEETS